LKLLRLQVIKNLWHLNLFRIFYLSKIYLVQTDTTVGFLSSCDKTLANAKERPKKQKILQEVDSCKTLKTLTRIPNKYKKQIRRLEKTTFIYPDGQSYRKISKNNKHYNFIKKFGAIYSTSANKTKESFSLEYAHEKADILVFTKEDFNETTSSKIYKISNHTIKKIR
jgi:tRNA A37 threonylcarbamoyladenosine synthetase subunit TsaC/SUA5/YrdC